MSKEGRGIPGGASGPVAVDVVGGKDHQYVKVAFGGEGTVTEVEASAPFPTTDATLVALSKAEDAAHSSGHTGIPALAVRRDTASSLAGSDNDYLPLTTDSAGRAWVNVGESTIIGAVNETAPASDTASSGLNGRLQRIAQRLTSLIALLPSSLGQKTAANSLAVVLPSDQPLQIADVSKVGRVVINANTSGNTTIITGAASVKYAILGMCLVAEGSVVVTLKEESEIPHTNLTGPMSLIVGVPLVWSPTSPDIAAIKTGAADKDVYLTLSANVQVSGWLVYAIVDA